MCSPSPLRTSARRISGACVDVEAARPLFLQNSFQLPFEALDRHARAVDHLLHRLRQALPAKARAQDRMAGHHLLPGVQQPGRIDAFLQADDDLLDVGRAVLPAQRVEQHSRL